MHVPATAGASPPPATTSSRINSVASQPHAKSWAQDVPECDECEDEDTGCHDPPRAAERDVEVMHDQEVVRAVPCVPEAERRVVVCHAAHHVLGGSGPSMSAHGWKKR